VNNGKIGLTSLENWNSKHAAGRANLFFQGWRDLQNLKHRYVIHET
jgi:hypothetical protein